MMLASQRRIVSQIMKCSPRKVVFDADRLSDIKEAITKEDLKALIQEGAIKRRRTNEQSRVRARKRAIQRSKGRQRGHGTHKGSANARLSTKKRWIGRIRLQRTVLKALRQKKEISQKAYRDLYLKAKGGFFRSKRHIELYITEHKLKSKK